MTFRTIALATMGLLLFACEPPPHQPLPQSSPRQSAAKLSAELPAAQESADYSAENYRLVSEKDEIVSVLKNGLVVITKRVASPVVAVRGYALTGGVYEGKWLGGGLSHLLEHLVAGGSNGRRSEAQNKQLLQEIGNDSNAFTTEDHTAFFVNTTTEHMDQAVDLVTGWMFTASITPDEYRREYQVVQRELEMGKGEPDRQFAYLMAMNRYRISPARVPVIGYQAVIQGLSRDDVYNYYKLAYVPNNMMFVVVGDEPPQKMLDAVRKHSEYPPGRVFSRDIGNEPPVQSPRTVAATFPNLGQNAQLNLAFPSVQQSNPDMYPLDLLAAVLGQSESAILVQELLDKRHLVTSISATDDTPSYVDGSFDITMEVAPDKVKDATAAVLDLVESLKNSPVDPQRIERAKALMRSMRIRQMLKAEDIAGSLGEDYLSSGDPRFSDFYLKRIDELSAADLQAAARKYFDRSKLITTTLFPAEFAGAAGLPKVEDLLRSAATTREVARGDAAPGDVQRFVLGNGTILLARRIPTSPLVTMQMYSLGGLTAEDAKTNGIGNLTMQMLVRGTKTKTARQIAEFFDSIGGTIGTACGNNTWGWNASCLTRDFDRAFDQYAEIVNNAAFNDRELAEMKRRIGAAIDAQDADASAQAGRFFKKEFYGPMNSPYQFLVLGNRENLDSFDAERIRDWYEQKVQAAPRVLAVFGDIDPEHVHELASKLLGDGPKRSAPQHPQLPVPRQMQHSASQPPAIDVVNVKVQKTEKDETWMIIGFKSNSVIGDPANYPLDVIDTLTSGFTYPTGYIFQTLRGLGLVYVADAHNVPGRDAKFPGTFEAYAGCVPENINRVVELTLQNIARVEGTPEDVNMDWFKRSKELMIVADAMENETPAAQAQIAAVDEVLGLGYDYHRQFADHVRQVTLADVQDISRERLAQCIVTISTPRPELVKVKPGVRTYTSFPPVDLAPKGVQHDVGAAGK